MYLTDIGRQVIILLLLSYIIQNTKIKLLRIIFTITFFIHSYKLFNNYKEYYLNTKKNIHFYLFSFIILLYSLNQYISDEKQILFLILFVILRIITTKLSNYKKIEPIFNHSIELILSFVFLIIYTVYKDYKYKDLFMMDSINHLLIFFGI